MQGFIGFMGSSTGRVIRAVAGIVLIALGLAGIVGVSGYIVAAIGLVVLAAGVFDFCLFAPLGGLPFNGTQLRAKLGKK